MPNDLLKLVKKEQNTESEIDQLTHFRAEGSSGTDISAGVYTEEYLNALTSKEAAFVFDEMRRADDQVKMLLKLVKNPILAAEWDIEAVDETPEELEIRDFAKFVFFENMGNPSTGKIKTWKDFIKECLTSIEFGYALFEISHKVVLNDPEFGDYIGIKELGWRSPKTIEEWNLNRDGSIRSVRQLVVGDLQRDVWMKGNFLFVVTPNKEGDNYEGISDLRQIYGNWFRKNYFRKLQMIGVERGSTGVPIGTVPAGQIESTEQTVFENIMKQFVMHEKAYLIKPEGWEIDELKITHKTKEVIEVIDQENEGMSRSFLANFMELGVGRSGGGSWALGEDLSDIFLAGIKFYPDTIIDLGNIKLMKPIIDAKFGKRRKYPKFSITGINDKRGEEYAKVVTALKEAGLIQDTPKVKAFLHKTYKLPEFDEKLEAKKVKEAEKVVVPPIEPKEKDNDNTDLQLADTKNKNISKVMEQAAVEVLEIYKQGMGFRGQKYIDNVMNVVRNSSKSKVMNEIKALTIPSKEFYKSTLRTIYANLVNQSTNDVLQELSLPQDMKFNEIDDLGKEVPSATKIGTNNEVNLVVETQDTELIKQVTFTVNQNLEKLSPDQVNQQLIEVFDRYLGGAGLATGASTSTANMINLARNAVFQTKEVLEEIESFIFMNPSPKAAVCVNLKGRVFTKAEYLTTANLPALHHRCNSYIRAQTVGKPGNKAVDPLGLSFTGTDDQVERIIKSKTF